MLLNSFRVDRVLPLHHNSIQELEVMFSLGRKSEKLRLRKKTMMTTVKRTPFITAALSKDLKPVKFALLVAMVSVRQHKADARETVKNVINNFRPQRRSKGAVIMQLVSTELDHRSLEPRLSKEAVLEWSKERRFGAEECGTYKVEFEVDSGFGIPGAVTIINNYESEFFLESITIERCVHFACKSWIQPNTILPHKTVFFTNKAYLPCETPKGLKGLREQELKEIRGDGKGMRIHSENIYDYDVYNDLGDPDKGEEYKRPTLGGLTNPHPRRCRTGRPSTATDETAESRLPEFESIYVPRDEELEDSTKETVDKGKFKGRLRNIVPSLLDNISGSDEVSEIDNIFKEPSNFGMMKSEKSLPKIFNNLQAIIDEFLKFDPPKISPRSMSYFLRDDEFARQMLAGINPLSIEILKEFPPKSKLDPSIYGPLESALEEEHIKDHLEGMNLQQAFNENKLFILDYHDFYLPFLDRITALEDRKTYATRTLFFLTQVGTLKPIAVELTLPSKDLNTPSKRVLTPPMDATSNWLWQLAKAHVCSNDAGAHQLVHHWLRTHACMEPFIIATHRQLSVMHPVFKLLHPHMRYTLKINAMARETLINAGGIIESDFTPGKYCMQISCAAYRDWWRFDLEPLPADLIRRGVAVPDASQPHGVRLLIEDYPYASDGLLIWSSIEKLVRTYVDYYYKDSKAIFLDHELQSWYRESINLGHADLKDAPWWPKLETPDDLMFILSTMIWIVSAQHAALNFGQYPFGGYVPTRPPLMRRLIPSENDPKDYASFVTNPKKYFVSSLPSLFQATKFMAVIDIISAHSPDEEYIGDRNDLSSWVGDPEIVNAFYEFSMEIRSIEKEIERRNSDPKLRNRCGAGVSPYELLIPSSGPGTTGRGVPKSITV
ncbi:linoleate 13S-lipoxygenase 3-1, chloroplastic-like [Neltuma alba]|uniref:linoleate 13S-lipoxygenase 3-1, chloroplastic-like n=1 Tax=Neltuma alba TaxID=207710 RepID=UPI0010A4F65B|nr:linoleate 13S-lipoxygenase 3-1, chloroplastic-like [Prosopis alba]